MAKSQFTLRKLFGIVTVSAVVVMLAKGFLEAISVPRNAITPSAIGETYYRIYLFAEKTGRLPKDLSELPQRQGYANRTTDVWGRQLVYQVDASGVILLGSYGRDGKTGGSGADADIFRRYRSQDGAGRFIAGDDLWVVDGEIHDTDSQGVTE